MVLICAAVSVVAVLAIFYSLLHDGYPVISDWLLNGFRMKWIPHQGIYGPIPLVVNTFNVGIGCTIVATIIGVPTAIYLAEFADNRLRNIIKPSLEILTGFPSIILGIVGLTIIVTAITTVAGPPAGGGLLAIWIVVGIMSLPTVATISEDAIRAVPKDLKEASLGLGATRWQTMTRVTVPVASPGILAAILLGMGNAIGETMAAFYISGIQDPSAIATDPIRGVASISVQIAQEAMSETRAMTPYFGLGFLLFFIIGVLNLIIRRLSKEQLAVDPPRNR
ncbi:MAG: phosphate ABC transporter permease subunit PstC [Nitrososphaerota archaeon]|nr:phosphate ABC transporter permease subunit PstC [Nitrososphaerota archaeon]